MSAPFTADEIADTITAALDSLMVREDDEDPTWLGAYSSTRDEVDVSAASQRFRVTVTEIEDK